MAIYLRGSSLADLTQPESGNRFLRRLFYCPDGRKGSNKMEFLVSSKIYLLLLGFIVGFAVGGGSAEADFIFGTPTYLGSSMNCSAYRCYKYKVMNSYPHDQGAFTQGLVFEDGHLYEGTGLYGQSTLRKVDLESGTVSQRHNLPGNYFGEGITIFGNNIIQLTWKSRVGFVYDKASFMLLDQFDYLTEGWGITHDGKRLIMSDGTSTLHFLDPQTFKEAGRIEVFDTAGPVSRINELEYVKGQIYANIWLTDRIAMISPQTGKVTGWIELMGLGPQTGDMVLNGIAYDSEADRLFVTGKLWPEIFEIELVIQSPGDFEPDGHVNMADFAVLAAAWLSSPEDGNWNPICDISRLPDNVIDVLDLAVLAEHWLEEYAEIVHIQWLGHSTVKVWTEDCVVYVDPERLTESLHDATLVCVTHTHGDHYSPSDIARVSNSETQFIGPPDVVQQYGKGEAIAPGQTIEFDTVSITGVASYNTNKSNHPKSRNWVGFVIELGSKRIYVAGDTDLIEEMKTLGDIDVAILPAGGTYTMNAVEAAEATQYIKPELAIPYHWGQNVGTLSDAETFAELAACAVKILTVGETISSDNWPEYSPLIAHWELDETEGDIAHESAGDNDGTCQGEPLWQPTTGKVSGALQFDGVEDYVSTPFVLNPADGAFSVFAWINGVEPVQSFADVAIISQMDGTGTDATWLGAVSSDGKLMTGLVPPPSGRSVPQPLVSEFVITDGQWHHIGLVWDGSHRFLYVDGTEAAKDTKTQAPLKASDGGLYIGAGKTLGASSFFWGLIDDVRIYNRALSAEDIEELAQ